MIIFVAKRSLILTVPMVDVRVSLAINGRIDSLANRPWKRSDLRNVRWVGDARRMIIVKHRMQNVLIGFVRARRIILQLMNGLVWKIQVHWCLPIRFRDANDLISEASEEESLPSTRTKMTTTQRTSSSSTSTTTAFRWWPWSSSTTMSSFLLDAKKTSRFRCLLDRQCASVDRNSHCSLFGRCVCNSGYQLGTINGEERCVREIKIEDDCDWTSHRIIINDSIWTLTLKIGLDQGNLLQSRRESKRVAKMRSRIRLPSEKHE